MNCSTHVKLPCPSLSPCLLKLTSIESVMPSNHLILYYPLLFLPSIFPSIRVFSKWSEMGMQTDVSLSDRLLESQRAWVWTLSKHQVLTINYWIPRAPMARALQQEKPLQWEACALQLESSPHSLQREKACKQQWRPSTAKNNKSIKKFFLRGKERRGGRSQCPKAQASLLVEGPVNWNLYQPH